MMPPHEPPRHLHPQRLSAFFRFRITRPVFGNGEQLTGDWWGARTSISPTKGVQIGVELNQYIQGVTNGGRDRTAAYGGTADYILNLDLMRMGISAWRAD